VSYVLVFVAISILILLHELGHFLAAKWVGIPIARFSIGYGRKLWGFRAGETEYRLSVFPCGGYVLPKMADEDAFEEFEALPLKKRLAYAIGGPVGNLVGAFVCVSIVSMAVSGISFHTAVSLPLRQIWHTAVQIFGILPMLFSQPDQLSGVVGIVVVGGKHVGVSALRLLQFCFFLNVNLAILNLLPIPPLDGGKVLMGVLQKVYDPLKRLHMPLAVTGWALLIGLMIYVTILDVLKITSGTYA
jgi:regulator of sigma E protease